MLAVNSWDEDDRDVQRYAHKNKLSQRILLNGSRVAAQYHIRQLPSLLWIDRQGRIGDAAVGRTDPAELDRKTQRILQAH